MSPKAFCWVKHIREQTVRSCRSSPKMLKRELGMKTHLAPNTELLGEWDGGGSVHTWGFWGGTINTATSALNDVLYAWTVLTTGTEKPHLTHTNNTAQSKECVYSQNCGIPSQWMYLWKHTLDAVIDQSCLHEPENAISTIWADGSLYYTSVLIWGNKGKKGLLNIWYEVRQRK